MTKKGMLTRGGLIFIIFIALFVVINVIVINHHLLDDSVNKNYVVLDDKDNEVSITNILPITDEAGKLINSSKNGMVVYKKISITNLNKRTSRYRILLNIDNKTTIDPKYVKVLVSDKDDKVLPFYDYVEAFTLNKLDNKNNSYVLHSSKLKKGDSDMFILRLWISTFYYVNDDNESFYGNISIYSY